MSLLYNMVQIRIYDKFSFAWMYGVYKEKNNK